MTELTIQEVSKAPKQRADDLKEPGDTTVWKDGRRHRKLKSGKVVVDAQVWSILLGRKVVTTHDNPTDAKRWQTNQRQGRYHGQEVDPRRAKLPFADIAAEWLASNPAKRGHSRDTDRHRLVGAGVRLKIQGDGKPVTVSIMGKPEGFAALSIGRITSAHVQELVDGWNLTHKPASVRGMYSSLRAVFHYAEKSRAIPKRSSPCEDIVLKTPAKTPRPVLLPDDADLDEFVGVWALSNEDLARLADALGPNYSLMVWIAISTGARREEICGLTVSSMEVLTGLIKVEQALDREGRLTDLKSLAADRFFVDRDLSPLVAAHMSRRGLTAADGDKLLFVNANGGPVNYSSFRRYFWLPALKKAGLDRKKPNGHYLGLHDLRSMNASIMDSQGVDAATSRYRRGHSTSRGDDDQMASIYERTSPSRNRMASEKIHAVLRIPQQAVQDS